MNVTLARFSFGIFQFVYAGSCLLLIYFGCTFAAPLDELPANIELPIPLFAVVPLPSQGSTAQTYLSARFSAESREIGGRLRDLCDILRRRWGPAVWVPCSKGLSFEAESERFANGMWCVWWGLRG